MFAGIAKDGKIPLTVIDNVINLTAVGDRERFEASVHDCYRFAARSVNLTSRLCVKSTLRLLADELETKAGVKNLIARLFLLACEGPGGLSRGNTEFCRLIARKFLAKTPIDTPDEITVYKKVIIFLREGRDFCDFGLFIVG